MCKSAVTAIAVIGMVLLKNDIISICSEPAYTKRLEIADHSGPYPASAIITQYAKPTGKKPTIIGMLRLREYLRLFHIVLFMVCLPWFGVIFFVTRDICSHYRAIC